MRRPLITFAFILALGSAGAVAAPATIVSLEDGIEASTTSVTLPESVPTRWSFRPCTTCSPVNVTLDEGSALFVGRDPVSLATLRKYAARGPANLDVYSDPKTGRVTRVILRAELDAADRAAPPPRR